MIENTRKVSWEFFWIEGERCERPQATAPYTLFIFPPGLFDVF